MANYDEYLDDTPPPRRRGWWRLIGRHLPGLSVMLMVSLLMAVVLWPYVVITVPSGRVGVLWKRFNGFDLYCWCFVGRGTILDPRELREEGLHIIWPWDRLFVYDLRLQSATQTFNAISKDGVNVTAQISVRYQLLHNSIGVLHKFIGPGYLASVVSPEIGSQARQVIAQYTAGEVYTSREAIQKQIRENAQKSLGANLNQLVQPEAMEQPDPKHYNDFLQDAIQILDTLVLSIELPPDIVAAINRQTEEFYAIQEAQFRVAREAQESKRKQIEADGIAAFQRTVSQGISDSYLRWRGIEATLELAQSPNAKIVIVGSGKDGLPIILGNVDTPAVPAAALQPGATGATPGSATAPGTSQAAPSGATTPGTAPNGGASTGAEPPGGSPNGGAPPASETKPHAEMSLKPANPMSLAPANPMVPPPDNRDEARQSRSLSDTQSAISRLTDALRSSASPPTTGPAPQSKQ
jgi:regulator of protease activity HflC (stomatin/prohibitin superfamily)